jgi:2-methylisocitrate lyase-like PEP mutase family enzyme
VRAAAENRPEPDLVLIARTDARAVVGLDDAIERVNRALEAGADVAFVEAPQTIEELAEIPHRVEGPCLLNIVAGGRTPDVSLQEAADLGYRLVIVPVLLLAAVLAAGDAALEGLASTGRHPHGVPVIGVEQIFRRAGAEPWDEVRARYDAD